MSGVNMNIDGNTNNSSMILSSQSSTINNLDPEVETTITNLQTQTNNLQNYFPFNFFLGKYETGPYAFNGEEYLAGLSDYLTYLKLNGGINDLEFKIIEDSETMYNSTYLTNLVKQKEYQNGGISCISTLSTGGAYALYEYSAEKKIPLLTLGYGDNVSISGGAFPYTYNAAPTYSDEMASFLEAVRLKDGSGGSLDGKKIVYIYHNSLYGAIPLPVLKHFSKNYFQLSLDGSNNLIVDGSGGPVEASGGTVNGCTSYLLPVQHPGSGTLQDTHFQYIINNVQDVDAIFILAWGAMISATEKNLIQYPTLIPKMYYGWWSYNPIYRIAVPELSGVTLSDFSGLNIMTFNSMGVQSNDLSSTDTTILSTLRNSLYNMYGLTNYRYGYYKNEFGYSDPTMFDEYAGNLYMRGVQNAFVLQKAIEKAHVMYGSKLNDAPHHINGEQLKNAFDNLTITQAEIDAAGMKGNVQPITLSASNHKGCNGINVFTANSNGIFELTHLFLKYSDESVINNIILS